MPLTTPATTVESPHKPRTRQYREDLNGLRGLAIALVVVFHVWFGKVSGGVDVFLVLSGYFFVGSLVRRAEAGGSLNPLPAFKRVFVRLFPPIAAVTFLTAAAALVLLPRTRWAGLADELTAVLGFFQNWQLALTSSDYLAADGSVSPLQHLWSMAVQGQFYLVAIAVVLVVASCVSRTRPELLRPTLTLVFGAFAVASFTYAAVMSGHDQAWNYYDSAARLWEPSVGALAALMLTRWNITRVGAWPLALKTVLGIAGLASILLCGFFLDGAEQFPGPWTLVPTLAAIALIVSGEGNKTWTAQVLAHPVLSQLGSFAFALYLVHWPILVFALVVTGRPEAGFVGGTLIIAASLAVAYGLRMAAEVPIERDAPARRPILLASVVGAAVIVTGMFGWQAYVGSQSTGQRAADTLDIPTHPGALTLTDGVSVPQASMVPSIFDAPLDLPITTLDGCISDFQQIDIVTCTYGDVTADRTIALAGGSHSEHWITALDELGRRNGFRVDTYLKMGCPLVAGESPDVSDVPDCAPWSSAVIDRLAATTPDFVFTTASRPSPDGPGDVTPEAYVEVWHELEQSGVQVLAIRDTPWLHHDGVPYRAIDCLATATSADHCALPRADMLSDINPAWEAIAELSNVALLDLSDGVCGPDLCRVTEGNVLVYHDSHHLTASYVRTLTPELGRQLGSATTWW
ncbi:acyltransferase family protein [Rhodococcus globerulus]|uniref:acyltransferase family protein n=1 Tax=Rhodococcus globerulus TaxID=33008 RepID=UPI0039EB6FBC